MRKVAWQALLEDGLKTGEAFEGEDHARETFSLGEGAGGMLLSHTTTAQFHWTFPAGSSCLVLTAQGVYLRYVEIRYLQRHFVVPVFLCVFVFLLYLLGRFLAAGVGKFFWSNFERGIHRLPLVRNVYSSVKQVTDFLFSGSEIEYTRVIAVEYPRKGIWSLGLVTGDSMLEIRDAAGEEVMTVLMPTSPMPFTGFTVTVKKSETIDLNITMDQAFQFIVSCGVVIPPQQIEAALGTADTNDTALPAPAGDAK